VVTARADAHVGVREVGRVAEGERRGRRAVHVDLHEPRVPEFDLQRVEGLRVKGHRERRRRERLVAAVGHAVENQIAALVELDRIAGGTVVRHAEVEVAVFVVIEVVAVDPDLRLVHAGLDGDVLH